MRRFAIVLTLCAGIPARLMAQEADTNTHCWTQTEIRKVFPLRETSSFRAQQLDGCKFKVEAVYQMAGEHYKPGDATATGVSRWDAVYDAGKPVRFVAVYRTDSGAEDLGECYSPVCLYDATGKLDKDGITEGSDGVLTAGSPPAANPAPTADPSGEAKPPQPAIPPASSPSKQTNQLFEAIKSRNGVLVGGVIITLALLLAALLINGRGPGMRVVLGTLTVMAGVGTGWRYFKSGAGGNPSNIDAAKTAAVGVWTGVGGGMDPGKVKVRLVLLEDGRADVHFLQRTADMHDEVQPERWDRAAMHLTWDIRAAKRKDGETVYGVEVATADLGTLIFGNPSTLVAPNASLEKTDRTPDAITNGDLHLATGYATAHCGGDLTGCVSLFASSPVRQSGSTGMALVPAPKSSPSSEPEQWAGTFNGFTATNAFSLRVLRGAVKFSMDDPYAASGQIETKMDCEGRLNVPEGRSSFALRVPMRCSVGPSQLTPFLTYDAGTDSWLLTPNNGNPIPLKRTARIPSMN